MRAALRGLIGVVVLLLVWEAVVRAGAVPADYLPPPSVVFPQLVAMLVDPAFLLAVVATVLSWAIALALAIGIAVPAGLMLASVAWLRVASRTVVEFLRPIPAVALVPLLVVSIGGGPTTKIALAVFAGLWPILFNTIYAFDEIEPLQVDTARVFGAGRVRVLTRVALPSVSPFVLTGVRLSAAIGLAVVVSAEMLTGASGGIGQFILAAASGATRMDRVLAGVVVAGVLGYAINAALERVHRRYFGWQS
ncbi:ABC transporter permease [Kutzneria kofuensis]|uniref:NitT/TauT family transport system permease protein n=1 Tax=Kutzneria kofuensis TaxID=103725 RepID=A0A7W9KRE0_9PSEU|nr:ABC transporter permease subunit [Kutzneria kofuensis]MBB5897330.1 NitT/TauT family transport system permease protein [Kutzneria kofuensis]